MPQSWENKISAYCKKYNIPIGYLSETLYEPKVIPMIRGKAFEFSVFLLLTETLPKDKWDVDKPSMNAQLGFHDIDVRITHKPTKKVISVECKLAGKGRFKAFLDGHTEIKVKCMRSRTLGETKVKELAPKLGISEKVLAVHNDQYLPADFDIVISSIGNAFYTTDTKTGLFEWKPSQPGMKFLEQLGATSKNNLQDFAFNTIFAAKSSDLVIGKNGIICTRAKCKNKKSCGFIPNYPTITFNKGSEKPTDHWVPIQNIAALLEDIVRH